MASWSVGGRGIESVVVEAPNWIVALGLGLERIGHAASIERLACEALPNGTIIARDIVRGTGFVVQPALDEVAVLTEEPTGDEALALEEGVDRLAAIERAGRTVDACDAALDVAIEVVDAESGSVLLEQDGVLEFVVAVGPHADEIVGRTIPAGSGVAGYSMEKRRSVVLGNATDDPRHYGEVDRLIGHQTKEIACIPVMHEQKVFGVLELLNLPEGRRFTREDLHHLQAVANALGARLARRRAERRPTV